MDQRKNENAVVYARFSSHSQNEQSIEGQLRAAHEYAARKGYTIIHEYCDRAKTGTNDNREAFQQMLKDCERHKFTVIIVWKVDRFGRNREEITLNKYRAKKHGVRVEYVAESLGSGPESVILEAVLEGMAEYYSLQLSQNIRRGQLEGAKKHHVVTGATPIGYRKAADKTYEVDPDTAPIVQRIFQEYVGGATMAEVVRHLNDSGYRTRRGTPFTKNSLPRILKDERYIGTYTFRDIREEDVIPALVDKETFRRVQEMLKYNRTQPSQSWKRGEFMLTGKLFCGLCGASMSGKSGNGKSGKKYQYYVCMGRNCSMKPVRQDLLDEVIIREVNKLLEDDELLDSIATAAFEAAQQDDTTKDERAALTSQLAEAGKARDNYLAAIRAGAKSSTLVDALNDAEKQIEDIKKALDELAVIEGLKLTKDHILFFLHQFRSGGAEDGGLRESLMRAFVNSVFYYGDHIDIAYNYIGGSTEAVAFEDIEKAHEGKCSPLCAEVDSTARITNTFLVVGSVFVLTYALPDAITHGRRCAS